MLKLFIPKMSMFDENTQRFIDRKDTELRLEHSLLAISKWESKYEKPFLNEEQRTPEEFLYYILCMDTTGRLTMEDVRSLTTDEQLEIKRYIETQHTATTFSGKDPNAARGHKETITSELVYYWMVAMQIPFDAEKWNIDRLLTLIRICSIKNNPKKMSKKDTMINNSALNAARRKAMGTRG